MNDLTEVLFGKHKDIQFEEWLKQGASIEYNSGSTQRIVGNSIPSVEITLTYSNITADDFAILKQHFESNHANTFKVDATQAHDMRPELMGMNASVWAFTKFRFSVSIPQMYSGKISLISSVFFDFPQYQSLMSESSSYEPIQSDDTSFETVLSEATPYQVEYEYLSNSIFSNIGQSSRHIKDKGGLRKKWQLRWQLQEQAFLKLLTFYRKKGGIMGTFGIPEEGTTGIATEVYSVSDLDGAYSQEGGEYYVNPDEDLKTKAYFMKDSFQYSKDVNGIYNVSADIVEAIS